MDGSKKSANNSQTEAKAEPVEVRISAGTQAVDVISIRKWNLDFSEMVACVPARMAIGVVQA
eukprot:scaffold42376_cov70-Cyclotella_meneghiniana.AAC.4